VGRGNAREEPWWRAGQRDCSGIHTCLLACSAVIGTEQDQRQDSFSSSQQIRRPLSRTLGPGHDKEQSGAAQRKPSPGEQTAGCENEWPLASPWQPVPGSTTRFRGQGHNSATSQHCAPPADFRIQTVQDGAFAHTTLPLPAAMVPRTSSNGAATTESTVVAPPPVKPTMASYSSYFSSSSSSSCSSSGSKFSAVGSKGSSDLQGPSMKKRRVFSDD